MARWGGQGGDTLNYHEAVAGASQEIFTGLSVLLEIGTVYIPDRDDFLTYFSGGLALGDELQPTRATTVEVGYNRDVQSARGLAPELVVSDVAFVTVSHQLSRQAMISIYGQYFKYGSIGTDTVDLSGFMVGPSFTYAISPTVNIFASYTFYSQNVAGNLITAAEAVGSVELNQASIGVTKAWQ